MPTTHCQLYGKFKEDNPETWQEILDLHDLLEASDFSPQTLAQHSQSFGKIWKRLVSIVSPLNTCVTTCVTVCCSSRALQRSTDLRWHSSCAARLSMKIIHWGSCIWLQGQKRWGITNICSHWANKGIAVLRASLSCWWQYNHWTSQSTCIVSQVVVNWEYMIFWYPASNNVSLETVNEAFMDVDNHDQSRNDVAELSVPHATPAPRADSSEPNKDTGFLTSIKDAFAHLISKLCGHCYALLSRLKII